MAGPRPPGLQPRAATWVALTAAVLVVHGWLATWLAEAADRLSDGSAGRLVRLQVSFATVLEPAAAPQPPPVPAPPRTRPRPGPPAAVAAPEPAASVAAAEGQAVQPEATAVAPDAPPVVPEAQAAPVAPDIPAAAAAQELPRQAVADALPASAATSTAASSAMAFEWPLSTRLSYRLTGYYRGPVEGQAQVDWLRQGRRYQVHLEVSVGPAFAPLVARRMSSDGELGDDGLVPLRYDEETRVALGSTRRVRMAFMPERITLANGTEVVRPPGVQDTASQFVHLTWLFTTRPERLRRGEAVEFPLALPRRVEPWTYDVLGSETLHTPVGAFEAVHVRPRRASRPGGDLTAEAWFAPTLQHLPVRIVIRQDAETYVDLLLDRWPDQEAAATPR